MKKQSTSIVSLLLFFSVFGICASVLIKGNNMDQVPANDSLRSKETNVMIISGQQEPDKGIGPVKKVELGPLNKQIADDGKNIFNNKCFVCHDLDQKKVGPPLRTLTKDRTPEYIMNLLVNYVQMQKEDPILKDIYKKFNNLPMPDPALNQSQARSVLEYLRSVVK